MRQHTHTRTYSHLWGGQTRTSAYILRKFHAQFQIWANGIPEQPIRNTQTSPAPVISPPRAPTPRRNQVCLRVAMITCILQSNKSRRAWEWDGNRMCRCPGAPKFSSIPQVRIWKIQLKANYADENNKNRNKKSNNIQYRRRHIGNWEKRARSWQHSGLERYPSTVFCIYFFLSTALWLIDEFWMIFLMKRSEVICLMNRRSQRTVGP